MAADTQEDGGVQWPDGATVKRQYCDGSGAGGVTGWALRDANGDLVSVASRTRLDPSHWRVVEERPVEHLTHGAMSGANAFELMLADLNGAANPVDPMLVWVGASCTRQDLIDELATRGLYPRRVWEVRDIPHTFPRDFELPSEAAALAVLIDKHHFRVHLSDAFPGFQDDGEVNGADLVAWMARRLDLFRLAFGDDLHDSLCARFPGFRHGKEVNGAELVDWVSEHAEVMLPSKDGEVESSDIAALTLADMGDSPARRDDAGGARRGYVQDARLFMTELLGSVETLTGIAETHKVRTLADLMYLQNAILNGSFIDHYPGESAVSDVVAALPSADRWMKYVVLQEPQEADLGPPQQHR
jgi:hypothetical protein